jgi:hypothetical protein
MYQNENGRILMNRGEITVIEPDILLQILGTNMATNMATQKVMHKRKDMMMLIVTVR